MKLYLGIDGGQTAIKSILANERGIILGAGSGGPTLHFQDEAARQQVRESLKRAIQEALSQAGLLAKEEIESVFLGISGVDGPEAPAGIVYRELILDHLQARKIQVDLDAYIALAGAIPTRVGVIVISGTGSIAFGMNESGGRARAGGWGYLLGDEGSAYEIGRQALIAVERERDGAAPKTALTPLVLKALNIEDAGLIPQIIYTDSTPKLKIAQIAALATQAAQGGDPIAGNLFSRGGKGLGELACAVIRRLNFGSSSLTVSGVGGVFKAGELIWTPFREEVSLHFPSATLVPPRFSPLMGALILAYKNGGIEINTQLLDQLEVGLKG